MGSRKLLRQAIDVVEVTVGLVLALLVEFSGVKFLVVELAIFLDMLRWDRSYRLDWLDRLDRLDLRD